MAAMNMNQEQFKQLIREEKPVLVDFWAPWCSYCRKIGPAYEKIGEEYADSLAVGKINIDEEPRLAGAEGIVIASMQIPASDGLPGPGERISASGFIASISSTVYSSFRTTLMSGSTEPIS